MYNFLLLLNILKFGISYLFCELPKFQIIKHIHMPVLLNWLRNGHSAIFGLPVIIETEFFLFAFFTFSKWQKQPSVFTYSSLCSFHSCLWTIYFYLSSFHLWTENGMRWRESREVELETQDHTARHWLELLWRNGSQICLSYPQWTKKV